MKQRIINMIRNWVGFTPEIQNLVSYIDSFESNVAIYAAGQYPLRIPHAEPLIFPTQPERNMFYQGFQMGMQFMGGGSIILTEDQQREFAEMDAKATHFSKGGKPN